MVPRGNIGECSALRLDCIFLSFGHLISYVKFVSFLTIILYGLSVSLYGWGNGR